MKVVIFPGRSVCEEASQRRSLIRIPEVLMELRLAQSKLDAAEETKDLVSTVLSEDHIFHRSGWYKTLTTYVIQKALATKTSVLKTSDWAVSLLGQDSCIEPILQNIAYEEMISQLKDKETQSLQVLNSDSVLPGGSQLVGHQLSAWALYARSQDFNQGEIVNPAVAYDTDLKKLLSYISDKESITDLTYMGILQSSERKSLNTILEIQGSRRIPQIRDISEVDMKLSWLGNSVLEWQNLG